MSPNDGAAWMHPNRVLLNRNAASRVVAAMYDSPSADVTTTQAASARAALTVSNASANGGRCPSRCVG